MRHSRRRFKKQPFPSAPQFPMPQRLGLEPALQERIILEQDGAFIAAVVAG